GVRGGRDVGDADGPAALEAGDERRDPGVRERVTRLGDRGRGENRVRETGRSVAQAKEARRRSRDGHVDRPPSTGYPTGPVGVCEHTTGPRARLAGGSDRVVAARS